MDLVDAAARGSATASQTGQGFAFGAVSILNATATGIGCALAVEAGTHAVWRLGRGRGEGLVTLGAPDDRLVRAVHAATGGGPAEVLCTSAFPPSRGLKTSSSAAAALVRAAHAATGRAATDRDVVRAAVAASRAAGVTITGALDDQCATTLGGCHLTDNRRDAVLQTLGAERWHVAAWVPDAAIPKTRAAAVDASAIAREARAAEHLATHGRLPEALTRNGAAFTRLYAAAGLPVDERPARVALQHGALGAGLSGCGPAVAALFDARVDLPAVPGGSWTWTRAVPA